MTHCGEEVTEDADKTLGISAQDGSITNINELTGDKRASSFIVSCFLSATAKRLGLVVDCSGGSEDKVVVAGC